MEGPTNDAFLMTALAN